MDHPGVRCENCEDIEQVDGILAPCRAPLNSAGCPVPALSPEAAGLLEMRHTLISLKGLANPESILKRFGATAGDLKMLAMVEKMMNLKGTEDK